MQQKMKDRRNREDLRCKITQTHGMGVNQKLPLDKHELFSVKAFHIYVKSTYKLGG